MAGGSRWTWAAVVTGMVVGACGALPPVEPDVPPTPRKDRYTGPRASFQSEPDIRVRVGTGVAKREIDAPGALLVRPARADAGAKPVLIEGKVAVTSGPEGVVVRGDGGSATFAHGMDVEIAIADGASGEKGSLRVNGVRYPGFITIRPLWSARPEAFDVIVTMPVESYIPGVLTHELFKEWPRQTFECQAVASRTYALHERARSHAEGRAFDVEDSTQDQVYGGLAAAARPNEAAAATRGLVLAYDGALLRAYYSSACGGRPNSASRVWPTHEGYEFNLLPPLQGKPREHACQESKWYRWELVRPIDDVNQRLRAWGRAARHEVAGLTRLRRTTVAERNAAGRPVVFTLTDDAGREYRLTSEEWRVGLNHPVAGLPAITAANRVHSGDVDIEVRADEVRMAGRGWGHGVGMCQWCAKGLADRGMDWQSMIRGFYPGAEVVKAY